MSLHSLKLFFRNNLFAHLLSIAWSSDPHFTKNTKQAVLFFLFFQILALTVVNVLYQVTVGSDKLGNNFQNFMQIMYILQLPLIPFLTFWFLFVPYCLRRKISHLTFHPQSLVMCPKCQSAFEETSSGRLVESIVAFLGLVELSMVRGPDQSH